MNRIAFIVGSSSLIHVENHKLWPFNMENNTFWPIYTEYIYIHICFQCYTYILIEIIVKISAFHASKMTGLTHPRSWKFLGTTERCIPGIASYMIIQYDDTLLGYIPYDCYCVYIYIYNCIHLVWVMRCYEVLWVTYDSWDADPSQYLPTHQPSFVNDNPVVLMVQTCLNPTKPDKTRLNPCNWWLWTYQQDQF